MEQISKKIRGSLRRIIKQIDNPDQKWDFQDQEESYYISAVFPVRMRFITQ